jgi:predicted permease
MKRLLRLSLSATDARRDIERELRAHIDQRAEELIAQGMLQNEARRQAESEFGDYGAIANTCSSIRRERDRERRRRGAFDSLAQDIRYAARLLQRNAGFTVVALLTLALGIGATSGLFSVVYALLLRPLPFPNDEQLVRVGEVSEAGEASSIALSIPLSEQIVAQSRTLAAGGYRFGLAVQIRSHGEAREVLAGLLTDGAFKALGVAPLMGQLPRGPERGADGGDRVLISHGFWQSEFGGAADVLERTVQINNRALPISGVMPAGFSFPNDQTEIWLPEQRLDDRMRNRGVHIVEFVGRRRADVSMEQVQAELQQLYQNGQLSEPGSDPGHRIDVMPLRRWLLGDSRGGVLMLFGAVGLLLLIACANLAGLQLARVASRNQELAVRAALGAGRWSIVRQLTVEALMLGVLGCLLGALLAPLVQNLIVRLYPGGLPLTTQIRFDTRVLLFAGIAGLVAAILFGVLPALFAMRFRRASMLQSGFLRSTPGADRQRARRALVVFEIAIAVVLALSGTLVARSFARVLSKPAGFEADRLLVLNISISRDRLPEDRVVQFYQRLPRHLETVPGVVSASAVNTLPISGGDSHGNLSIEQHAFNPGAAPVASYRRVLPNYFRTMGIPLIAGREFDARDAGTEPFVVIVNETLARRHFGRADAAIGRRIKVGVPENEPWLTIVGVVGDVRNESLEATDEHATYEPHPQRPWRSMQLVIRTHGDPIVLAPAVRAALRELDQYMTIGEVSTMEDRIGESVSRRRFTTQLLGAFAVLALLLAALGIFGVTSHGVNERRRELGIRSALGASAAGIRRLVLGQSMWLAVSGALLGIAGSLAIQKILQRLLYEVSPTDPTSLLITVILLAGVSLVAAVIPARRAARTDPATVLREF